MRKLLSTLVLALIASLGLVATSSTPAHASGGSYPSTAVPVSNGSAISGGATTVQTTDPDTANKAGNEFYKVTLGFSDLLTVDFTNVTGGGTQLCVFAPTVTDFTLTNSNCLKYVYTTSSTNKAQLQYVAPVPGDYFLAVTASSSYSSWAYSATVSVQKQTQVTAAAKGQATVGHKIRVKGNASVAGTVTLQMKSGGWQNVAVGSTKPDGSYKLKYKPTKTGRAKFRVAFTGPAGYLSSLSGKVKVQVKR